MKEFSFVCSGYGLLKVPMTGSLDKFFNEIQKGPSQHKPEGELTMQLKHQLKGYFHEDDITSSYKNIPSVIWHMYGYFAMWNLFRIKFPPVDAIPFKNINKPRDSREQAWWEGWAAFFAIATGDRKGGIKGAKYYYSNGDSIQLKNTDWMYAVTNKDNVPGRIAGALFDMYDTDDDDDGTN